MCPSSLAVVVDIVAFVVVVDLAHTQQAFVDVAYLVGGLVDCNSAEGTDFGTELEYLGYVVAGLDDIVGCIVGCVVGCIGFVDSWGHIVADKAGLVVLKSVQQVLLV